VFSVDYRKAPENPYPDGLADVWQVYNWLLNESHKFFKIKKDKRIIVAGDSAGGNLIFSLTNLCIENGVRPPNTIVAFYPAVNLSLKCFTPSLLYSFSDPLLSFEFLLICVQSYITKTGFSPESDYFISPLFTPN
jgi:hormone-sensitive lipase